MRRKWFSFRRVVGGIASGPRLVLWGMQVLGTSVSVLLAMLGY